MMKRIIALVLSALLVLSLCMISIAVNMEIDDAEPVFEGYKSITFETKYEDDAHDQFRWYTFTPSATDYYVFRITNPFYFQSTIDTNITIYDSYIDAINDDNYLLEGIDEKTNVVSALKFLNEGQTYYIQVYCSASLEIEVSHTMTLNIERHSKHQYVKTIIKPSYFKDGYTIHECSICGKTYKDAFKKRLILSVPTGLKVTQENEGEKRFIVKFKKVSQASGYCIQYATNKKMQSAKTLTIKNRNTVKKAVKAKLDKKYYVRVRAYKIIEGKTIYSSWSTKKSIKLK